MAEWHITICDRCNPSGSLHPANGRGLYEGSRSDALDLGWKRIGPDDICLECIDEEGNLEKAKGSDD